MLMVKTFMVVEKKKKTFMVRALSVGYLDILQPAALQIIDLRKLGNQSKRLHIV